MAPIALDEPRYRTSAEVFDDCLAAGVQYREIRDLPESRRGDTWEADRRSAARNLNEVNDELDQSMRYERYEMERAAWDLARANPIQHDIRGPQAAFTAVGGGEARTAGQQFVESEQYRDRENGRTGDVEVRNLLLGGVAGSGAANLFVPVGTPTLSPGAIRQQRLFVRDLLTVQNTGLASVPYIRELNAGTNETGASAVLEASAKPEVTMQFEQDDAPIRKIAAWIQATMEALDDAPTLRGYIDTRLGYMVLLKEEAEVLNGVGTAPHIKGIRQFSGKQTASGEFYDGVAAAIGKIENVDGYADGIVANPLDYWAAVTDRHATFYDGSVFGAGGGSPFQAPAPTAWGLPVVRSRSMESGKALVGSWKLGATMFEREGVTLRSTDSHASLFVSNTVVILGEERVGLAVHRPDFFCEVTVSAPS